MGGDKASSLEDLKNETVDLVVKPLHVAAAGFLLLVVLFVLS